MSVHQHVACPGCGCVCDDLTLTFQGDQLIGVEPRCGLAEDWFRRHWDGSAVSPLVNGHPATLDAAIDRAAELLRAADYPLIYGLSRADTSGQRAAVALAEQLGGVIDSTASLCHGPSIMALQETGEVTSTLGEIRNRADLVIYWGCDPATTHPRHAERYSTFASGRWVRGGREDRTLVIVGDADQVEDWRLDSSGAEADLVIPVEPGNDFDTINQLIAALHGDLPESLSPPLKDLLQRMTNCTYGVVFFGLGLAKTRMWDAQRASQTGHHDVAALLKLVAELNAFTRFTARRMRLQGDVSGADNVLLWQTSYPFGVDYSRGFPRYNPGEYTANELLERHDVDTCLLLGAETVPFLSDSARQHLDSIPTISIDYPGVDSSIRSDVQVTTAVHGIHASGTIYRMDNVPLSLASLVPSDLPTDRTVLDAIGRKVIDEDAS